MWQDQTAYFEKSLTSFSRILLPITVLRHYSLTVFSQINLVHILPPYVFKIHFNIIIRIYAYAFPKVFPPFDEEFRVVQSVLFSNIFDVPHNLKYFTHTALAQLIETLCYKPEGRGFDS